MPSVYSGTKDYCKRKAVMELLTFLNTLEIGEVGDRVVEIRDSISTLSYSSSADTITEIKFTVHDPGFRMNNANYFMIGRRVVFNGLEFEIAAIGLAHGITDTTEITARCRAMQRMRRQKGQKSYGAVSPTVVAAAAAAEFGLEFFGESSPADGEIVRYHDENRDESTLDMLARLAQDLDFRFFEARNTLFFASESFITDNQNELTINIPSETADALYGVQVQLRRSIDAEKPATFQANLIKNVTTTNLYPGMTIRFTGPSHFDGKFMIDRVAYDMQPATLVDISGTDVTDYEAMNCSLNDYARGSQGECVKRIQIAVGTTADGIFGPVTERAVKAFQTSAGLPSTGVVDSATWEAIIGY